MKYNAHVAYSTRVRYNGQARLHEFVAQISDHFKVKALSRHYQTKASPRDYTVKA